MKAILRRIIAFTLSVILLCPILPAEAANFQIPGTCQVQVNAGPVYTVKTLDYSYANNTYLSLRDMAGAFENTDRAFSLTLTKNTVSVSLGGAYTPVGAENQPWESDENPDITLRRNKFEIDGEEVSYYTMIMKLPSGYYDCFIMAADLAMILDVDITLPAAGSLQFNTEDSFRISPDALEQAGYFYGVNAVLVGDATTGELYYQYQPDVSYPIASTSKLMTYLLTMEAVSAGQITLEDRVSVSEAAQMLSSSSDGVIPLEAGTEITVGELLIGALLPSSNECALCLAEAVAGSEEAFVQKMNEKASELGLSQAVFFNCNGLPSYTEASVPSKRQNRMSAEDMFRLVSHILKVYPQITDITSLEISALPSLEREVRNTNPLLYNMPEVTGLKTGTTNRAGACLVTTLAAGEGNMEHDLVVVVLGTEDSIERGRVSGLLARYALNAFYGNAERPGEGTASPAPENLPTHAEVAVDWVIRNARRR